VAVKPRSRSWLCPWVLEPSNLKLIRAGFALHCTNKSNFGEVGFSEGNSLISQEKTFVKTLQLRGRGQEVLAAADRVAHCAAWFVGRFVRGEDRAPGVWLCRLVLEHSPPRHAEVDDAGRAGSPRRAAAGLGGAADRGKGVDCPPGDASVRGAFPSSFRAFRRKNSGGPHGQTGEVRVFRSLSHPW
jgi:hypothetical protein